MNTKLICFEIVFSLLVCCCIKPTIAASTSDIPPVYVTIAGHIEDSDKYSSCVSYPDFRSKLLVFADVLHTAGIPFNLQIDYNFLAGTIDCENSTMRDQTGGLNIIDYLAREYDCEIDAHQEGGKEDDGINYADVRYLTGTLTSLVSENAGGVIWNDAEQFARLAQGEQGWLYPGYTWQPEVLSLAVSDAHHDDGDFSNDDIASGIWKPQGANESFWVHNALERMAYIGPGEHIGWGKKSEYLSVSQFIQHLVQALHEGTIPQDKMYTVTLTVPQSVIFNANRHSELTDMLNRIQPYIQSNEAQYVTYSKAEEIWRTEFDAEANMYWRTLPAVATSHVSSVTSQTAVCGGHIVSNGSTLVTDRGVCWSESERPTLEENYSSNGTVSGNFTSSLTGLSPQTTYHVRAYATNSAGTAYGDDLLFTTLDNKIPEAATLISPSGTTCNTLPTYAWNKVSEATWYQLWLSDSAGCIFTKWYQAFEVTSGATCSARPDVQLSSGEHTWWVQTWNENGYGPWSEGMSFQVIGKVPGAVTLIAPSGNISETKPSYTWNVVTEASWYRLYVRKGSSGSVHDQWYHAPEVSSDSTCAVSTQTSLCSGEHTWWVQTWNENGYGPWSEGMEFTVE